MTSDFGSQNPYATPAFSGMPPGSRQALKGRVMPPAIALTIVGSIGLAISAFNVAYALTQRPQVDPNLPEFFKDLQQGTIGAAAAGAQGTFSVLNLLILLGGIQMLRFRTWGFALAASIMAMLD